MDTAQRRNPTNQTSDDSQPDLWTAAASPSAEPVNQSAILEDEAGRIAERLQALTHSKFRMSWHLKVQQVRYIHEKGIDTIAKHCDDLIATRLAPAIIPNDGSQTPMKGHPVFIAQHATGTCCRSCLKKWHRIEPSIAFTPAQQHYVTTLIMTWIRHQLSRWQQPDAMTAPAPIGRPLPKPRRKNPQPQSPNPTADLFDQD